MPAAAVIPAPIAYIKVVAVKKLVVGFLVEFQSQLTSTNGFLYSSTYLDETNVLLCFESKQLGNDL